MKLNIRIPLLFGLVILITSISISLVTLQISSGTLETSILNSVASENRANTKLLSALLNGQLDIFYEISNRARSRTMVWDTVRPSLTNEISRIGALAIAMVTPEGISMDVGDESSLNLRDRAYFTKAMAGEKNIDVVLSRQTNRIVVLFASPVFASDERGAPVIGVMIAQKDVGRTLSDIVVNLESSMKSGYNYLVDSEGTMIAHPNTDLVTSQFNPVKAAQTDPSYKALGDVVATALRERSGELRYTYEGKSMLAHYDEVPGYPWLLFSTIEKSDVDSQLSSMRFIVLIIAVSFLIAGLVFAFFIGMSIVKPISRVAHTLRDIAEGEGDLTRTITVLSRDELGDLSGYFNQTLGKISTLISRIKHKVNALTNTGHELTLNMTKTSEVVNDLSINAEEMEKVKKRQEESAGEANKAVKNIQNSIDSMHRLVEEQSNSVETSSSAIEEMIANIHSVTKTLIANTKNVDELSGASENGKAGLQTVAEKIQEIARESEGLLEINSVMENIASQTNLLSMNAAIEAAHAGEAGKGFAVVADEIRKLAESSAEQSKTTSDMLKKIKNFIDSIIASSNDVLSRFEVIDTGVKTVSQHEQNIRSAMEEQEVGGQQLLQSIAHLKELSVSVEKGSTDMTATSSILIKQTNELITNSNDTIIGMNKMLTGAMQQIRTAVSQVDEMSTENTKNFEDLKQETNKFKISSGNEKKIILLVDDDKTYHEITGAILKKEYEVITTSSGKAALQLFYQGLVPDLVLLDLMMPEMSGFDAFERIRGISKLHKTPIAICSGSDDPQNMAQAKRIGAVDFINKPAKDLLGRVKKLL
jgi:methyl-accepting chemotaxis protein